MSFFGIQISEAGLNLINWFDSAADRTLISTPYVMIFPVFNELGWDVFVGFVDCSGTVNHHCLNFLLIHTLWCVVLLSLGSMSSFVYKKEEKKRKKKEKTTYRRHLYLASRCMYWTPCRVVYSRKSFSNDINWPLPSHCLPAAISNIVYLLPLLIDSSLYDANNL